MESGGERVFPGRSAGEGRLGDSLRAGFCWANEIVGVGGLDGGQPGGELRLSERCDDGLSEPGDGAAVPRGKGFLLDGFGETAAQLQSGESEAGGAAAEEEGAKWGGAVV